MVSRQQERYKPTSRWQGPINAEPILKALTDSFPPELFTAPGNVHFKTEGSKKLGDAVAAKIPKTLGKSACSGDRSPFDVQLLQRRQADWRMVY